jgi:nicotinamidase-related amidase
MGPGGLRSAALVISECQRGILDPAASGLPALAAQAAERGAVARIAALASAFRSVGLPVVHCHIAHRPDLAGVKPNSLLGALAVRNRTMIAGTPDALPTPELAPQPGDHVSCRTTGITAFYGTDLDAILRLRSVETIVLTGVSTDVAIPGLAIEAVNRGYYVRIPADCVAGSSSQSYEFMLSGLLPIVARITDADAVLASLAELVKESDIHDATCLPGAARRDRGVRGLLDRRRRRRAADLPLPFLSALLPSAGGGVLPLPQPGRRPGGRVRAGDRRHLHG